MTRRRVVIAGLGDSGLLTAIHRPRRGLWGSLVGVQPNGLEVFAPNGRAFRFPAWTIRGLLQGLIVERGIYRGVRSSWGVMAGHPGVPVGRRTSIVRRLGGRGFFVGGEGYSRGGW